MEGTSYASLSDLRLLSDTPLSEGEQRVLKECAIALNRLCERLYSIDWDWCKREEEMRRLSRSSVPEGIRTMDSATVAAMLQKTLCADIPNKDAPTPQGGCLGSAGEPGMLGEGPIGRIARNVQECVSQIGMLFHKEFLQTTVGRESLLTWFRQSDDEYIREQTDKAIAHSAGR